MKSTRRIGLLLALVFLLPALFFSVYEISSLNKDEEMVSVQGHLIMLKDQNPRDLQYMILVYFAEDKTKSGQKIKRSLYMFPKQLSGSGENEVGVIGGTFIEGATSNTPNKEEFDIMIQNAKKFYGLQK